MANTRKAKKREITEGLAVLIENVMEKSEVVLLVKAIRDKLTGVAEDLANVEAKDIMPLFDSMVEAFGTEVADNFNNVVTEQLRSLVAAVQNGKGVIDKEIVRLEKGVEGGDISDMGMDAAETGPEAPAEPPVGGEGAGQAPAVAPPEGGLPEVPADVAGNTEDDALGGNFAGRSRKESAKPRGKMIEDFISEPVHTGAPRPTNASPPAIDQHPHKSVDFATNLHNLGVFHGKAGEMGRNIESMIDNETLDGKQRKALANVLSSFSAFAAEPAHWSDAEVKLSSSLQAAGIWNFAETPAVAKIVGKLRTLAHFLNMKHAGIVEANIIKLRRAPNPDAMIVTAFRSKLREKRDAQMAAIQTARMFAIDIGDVVTVVREAKQETDCKAKDKTKGKTKIKEAPLLGPRSAGGRARDTEQSDREYIEQQKQKRKDAAAKGKAKGEDSKKPVKEFQMDTPDSAKGMFKGKSTSDLQSRKTADKSRIANADKQGKGHARDTKDLERVNFAIRAHKSKGGKGWHRGVNEEDLLQGVPMFPVNSASPATATAGQPPVGGPQQNSLGGPQQNVVNPSTRKPLSPQDKRMQQQNQVSQQQAKGATGANAQAQGQAQVMEPPPPGNNTPTSAQQPSARMSSVQPPAKKPNRAMYNS